jgi:hypothetical protein
MKYSPSYLLPVIGQSVMVAEMVTYSRNLPHRGNNEGIGDDGNGEGQYSLLSLR